MASSRRRASTSWPASRLAPKCCGSSGAVIGARFHDPDARAAYEEVFLRDMRSVFGAACRLAADAGLLPPAVSAGGLASLLVAIFEHALGDTRSEEDLPSLRARLEEMMSALSALLAR